MMKGAHIEQFLSWIPYFLMEWNIDFDQHFDPGPRSASLCVFSTILHVRDLRVFSAQLSIDVLPVYASNIFWTEVWVADYLEKVLEA